MFVDNTNMCFEHWDLRILFSIVNEELNKIYEWYNASKLLLNADKINYLPLLLLKLLINEDEVEIEESLKFFAY